MNFHSLRMHLRLVPLIALFGTSLLQGQDYASSMFLEHELAGDLPLASIDSIPAQPKRRLMPENISLMEKTVWGENGILRGVGLVPPLAPEERKTELQVRRVMLTSHQVGGFVTLGLLGGAVYCGQMLLNGDQRYFRPHKYLVEATIISYTTTGALALLSPPPLIRRDEISTITIHKALAWVHITGMIVTPIIGGMLRHSLNYNQLAHYHQISAYVTTGALAAAMLTVTL